MRIKVFLRWVTYIDFTGVSGPLFPVFQPLIQPTNPNICCAGTQTQPFERKKKFLIFFFLLYFHNLIFFIKFFYCFSFSPPFPCSFFFVFLSLFLFIQLARAFSKTPGLLISILPSPGGMNFPFLLWLYFFPVRGNFLFFSLD